MDFPENTTIVSQNKQQIGVTTGAMYACQMSGCRGQRITTRWEDKSISHPCSRGLAWDESLKAFVIQ
jgi:hypothetical protein